MLKEKECLFFNQKPIAFQKSIPLLRPRLKPIKIDEIIEFITSLNRLDRQISTINDIILANIRALYVGYIDYYEPMKTKGAVNNK